MKGCVSPMTMMVLTALDCWCCEGGAASSSALHCTALLQSGRHVVAHPRSRLVNVQMNRRSVMVCVLRLAVYIFSEEVLTIEMSRIDWERLVCARAIYALPFKGQIPWELALKYAEVSVSRLRLFGATCWARSKLLMAKSKHLFLCSTQLCFR